MIVGAWYSWRPHWNLDMVMFGLAVRMHQAVYAYGRHCLGYSLSVCLCSLGNGSGCWVKLVRRCRKLPQGWRGCSFGSVRVGKGDREEQLDIYRQEESVESFKEVLFPLKTWQFQVSHLPVKITFLCLLHVFFLCASESWDFRWIAHHQQVCRVKCNPFSRPAAVSIQNFLC